MGDFRVVAENSEADLKKRDAEEHLAWPLKELAANLLRVIRGAGSSATLMSQMNEVLLAAKKYHEAFGHWPESWTLNEILVLESPGEKNRARVDAGSLSRAALERWEQDGTMDQMYAEYKICRGVLQWCASELVQQKTQARSGESEMHDGIRALEAANKVHREAMRPKQSPSLKPKPKPNRKPKTGKPRS